MRLEGAGVYFTELAVADRPPDFELLPSDLLGDLHARCMMRTTGLWRAMGGHGGPWGVGLEPINKFQRLCSPTLTLHDRFVAQDAEASQPSLPAFLLRRAGLGGVDRE